MTGGVVTLRFEDVGGVGPDWLNHVAEAHRRFATGTLTGKRMIHEAKLSERFASPSFEKVSKPLPNSQCLESNFIAAS